MNRAFVFVVFSVLSFGLFAPVILRGGLLAPGDGVAFFVPAYTAAERIWDPYLFSGFPALGDPQQMTWYPLRALLARIPGSWNAFVLSGYALAGFFTWLWLHRLSATRLGAFVGGATFATSAFLIGHVRHPNIVHTAAWLPAALVVVDRLRAGPRLADVSLGALVFALAIVAGHPQVLLYTGLVVLANAVFLHPGGETPRTGRFLGAVVAAGGLGLALAAVLVLPAAELVPNTFREELSEDDFFGFALPPHQAAEVFFPYLYGGFGEPYGGEWTRRAAMGYVGFAPLFLAAIAVGRRFRSNRHVRFFAAVAAVSFLLAMGGGTPLGELLFRVPLLNLFRAPGRHLYEFTFALSVLAGLGVRELGRPPDDGGRAGVGVIVAGVSAALLLLLGIAGLTRPEGAGESLGGFLLRPGVGISVLYGVAAIVALMTFARFPRAGAAALGLVVITDLGTWAIQDPWRRDPPTAATFEEPEIAATVRARLGDSGQRLVPFHGVNADASSLPPNRSRLWRIPSTGGYNPLRLKRTCELLELGRRARFPPALVRRPAPLDLLAVRFLTARTRNPSAIEPLETAEEWTRVRALDTVNLYERRDARPRAWIVPRARKLSAPEILTAVGSGRLPGGEEFDPSAVALVEEEIGVLPRPRGTATSSWETTDLAAVVTRVEARRIDVRTSSRDPAFVVLSDIHYPGWRVRCDEVAASLYRCNYALMGTAVPAGEHTVSFRFEPASLRWGGAISVLTALALLGVNGLRARRGGRGESGSR